MKEPFLFPENNPLNWAASISHQIIAEKREVKVSFTAPPETHNFTEFKVSLENVTGGAKQVADIQQVMVLLSIVCMVFTLSQY